MSGLCGWIERLALSHPRSVLIESMASTLAHHPDDKVRMECRNGGALATVVTNDGADLYTDDDILAAVEGRPHWSDTSLAEIARHEGSARALISGYREHGLNVLQVLHGAFAVALLEPRKRQALLAIDRLGIRRLTYTQTDDALVFGATLDSLGAYPSVRSDIDPQGIFNYVYFSMVPSPGTIYSGQRKLEPAQYLRYADDRVQTGYYWEPDFDDSAGLPAVTLKQALHHELRQAVQRDSADCRAGAFLSGGLDSSTVCGILSTVCHATPPRTYSIGFDVPGYDEMRYARIAARHFQTQAHEYYVTPQDVFEAIPRIAHCYDEPFGNSSALPVYYCAREARNQGVNIMLAGDGGDEIFAGNERYLKQKVFELYSLIPSAVRRRLIEPIVSSFPGVDRITPIRKLRRYIEQANVPLPDRLETYNILHMAALEEIFESAFLDRIDVGQPLDMLRSVYGRARSEAPLNRMLYLDWKFTLADNDLRKVNRMCEAHGVEVRYPMLDHGLVQLSTRIPANLKIKRLQLRHFYKQAMADFLPREIITKPKHGFGLPFGEWLRASPGLQEMVHDCLQRLKTRGFFRPSYIERVVDQHRHEHVGFYGTMLWIMTILELWLRERASPASSLRG